MLLGEAVGHWIHDLAGTAYQRYHKGRLEPEARLIPIYMATPIMIFGIVIVGVSLERIWHYMVVAVGLGVFVFGIMIVTTSINSYVLDVYPEAPGEISARINAGRTIGGFIVSYFELTWAEAEGTQKSRDSGCSCWGGVPHFHSSDTEIRKGSESETEQSEVLEGQE